ncbi:IS5 family transposase [Symmachiella macrocystis]|uniref:IS5 family transposase n=1 Tax=Symmachiella macrocystis TaxID=2527985 RepID=UPI0036F3D2FC
MFWPSVRRHKHGVQDGAKTQLTDEQWDRIKDLFPWEPPTRYGGRPRKAPRDCLEGILWVLRSGARWKDLPNSFPSFSTCWRRFRDWTESGVFKIAWARLLDDLGEINWEEAMADGTFSPAKKGAPEVGKTKRGKGTKIMLLINGEGLPLGVDTESASASEVNLIERLVDRRTTQRPPARLIYDKAGDSDPLRERLAARGIDLICPHRRNRKRPATQDGRKVRRYRRRYEVERTIAWLQYFRRLVTRYEYHAHLFQGFAQLACLFTVLQTF